MSNNVNVSGSVVAGYTLRYATVDSGGAQACDGAALYALRYERRDIRE